MPHGHSLKHLLCESDVANGVEVAGATGTVNAGVDGRDVVAAVPFILVPSRSLMLTTIAREGVGGVPVGFAREGPRLEARRPCPPDAAASTSLAGCRTCRPRAVGEPTRGLSVGTVWLPGRRRNPTNLCRRHPN